jgi:hypothetical protein
MTKALLTKLTTHGAWNVLPHDGEPDKKFAMDYGGEARSAILIV